MTREHPVTEQPHETVHLAPAAAHPLSPHLVISYLTWNSKDHLLARNLVGANGGAFNLSVNTHDTHIQHTPIQEFTRDSYFDARMHLHALAASHFSSNILQEIQLGFPVKQFFLGKG